MKGEEWLEEYLNEKPNSLFAQGWRENAEFLSPLERMMYIKGELGELKVLESEEPEKAAMALEDPTYSKATLTVIAGKMVERELKNIRMIQLRREGKTMEQIAQAFGVSRQRIQQMASKLSDRQERAMFIQPRRQMIETPCGTCGVHKRVDIREFKGDGLHYCKGHKPKKSKEQTLIEDRARAKRRYWASEDYRKRHAASVKKSTARIRAAWTPEQWAKHRATGLAAVMKYFEKQKARRKIDPEFNEKMKAKQRDAARRMWEKKRKAKEARLEVARQKLKDMGFL